jgi:hypothetical protein
MGSGNDRPGLTWGRAALIAGLRYAEKEAAKKV